MTSAERQREYLTTEFLRYFPNLGRIHIVVDNESIEEVIRVGIIMDPYMIELIMEIGSDDSWYTFVDLGSAGEEYHITIPFEKED